MAGLGQAYPREGQLEGRVAIVTGAGQGIGRAVAEAFAREGARVVIAEIDREVGRRAEGELRGQGLEARFIETDVSDAKSVEAMAEQARSQFGPVDILVNNAAWIHYIPWLEMTEQDWDRMMATNLKGPWLCSRAVYPDMKAKGYGKIINLTSITVELGVHKDALHYISSKAGVIGFTRALAREVGRDGIRVNAIMPGAIRTESELRLFPDQERLAAELARLQCIPRRGFPQDLAGGFLFLASPESDFVTGQVLCIDGGWAMY